MPAPPAEAPGSEVAHLAHEVRIACMRVSRRVRFETSSTIAPHQFSALARLDTQACTIGELASRERVSAPSMSRTVAGLVERGLVDRTESPEDGRVVVVSLTEQGRRSVAEQRAKRDEWMATRLEQLSAKDRGVLARATEILNGVLAE